MNKTVTALVSRMSTMLHQPEQMGAAKKRTTLRRIGGLRRVRNPRWAKDCEPFVSISRKPKQ